MFSSPRFMRHTAFKLAVPTAFSPYPRCLSRIANLRGQQSVLSNSGYRTVLLQARWLSFTPSQHDIAISPPSSNAPQSRLDRDQVPSYELTFTCNVCQTRSSHRLSKQGYHHGTVLITCPDCKNRHLISDHLKIFSDKSVTIEDLMRDKGDLVKKGSLSAKGDIEFWDDGSTQPRSAQFHSNFKPSGTESLSERPPKPESPKD